MTANLKRFDPAGSDGATATATGNLTSVIVAGAGAVTYEADYGMNRGANMGLRAVAPGTADQANTMYATTAAAAGTVQVYGSFENWPTGGSQEFVTLRTSAGNCIRQLVSTAGSVTVQNKAGSTVATLGTISLNTPYRFELEATPGTTTSNGSGRARIYDDSDTLVYDSGALTAGDYGGTLSPNTPSVLRVGDPTTATTSAFAFGFTQPAIDTAATPPTITPITKGVIVNKTVNDAAGATDTGVDQALTLALDVADSAGGSDSVTGVLGASQTQSDSAGSTDSVTDALAAARIAADPAGGADSAAATLGADRSQSDVAGATDSASASLEASRPTPDTAGSTDGAVSTLTVARTATDGAGATDAVVADLVGAGSAAVDDTAGASDATATAGTWARTQADAAGAIDLAATTAGVARPPTDAAGATDVPTTAFAAARASMDLGGAADALMAMMSMPRGLGDSVGLSDQVVATLLVATLTDTPPYRTVRPRQNRRVTFGGAGDRTIRAMKRRA